MIPSSVAAVRGAVAAVSSRRVGAAAAPAFQQRRQFGILDWMTNYPDRVRARSLAGALALSSRPLLYFSSRLALLVSFSWNGGGGTGAELPR
jgi:hypothetical protein